MVKNWDYDSLSQDEQYIIVNLVEQEGGKKTEKQSLEVNEPNTLYTRFGKRFFDIVIAIVAIVITFPVNIVVALVTLIDVGFPIFFVQDRIGKNEKIFKLIKFRNMTNERDENGVLLTADKRVTKWGTWVRRTSIDELLNFYNVLNGSMSIIGPRPLPKEYKGRFSTRHASRHKVKPGLECPLINNNADYMTWENRLENDVWYVEHVCFKVDVLMLTMLIKQVFCGRERSARGNGGSEGSFVGYDANGNVLDSHHLKDSYYYKMKELVEKA